MSFRTTLVLLAILGVLAGAWAFVSRRGAGENAGREPTLLSDFDQTRVESIRVENLQMGYRVGLSRVGADAWKVTGDVESPADEALVSQILSSVQYNTRKVVARFEAGRVPDLEGFGLAKPRAVIDFELKGAPGKETERERVRLLVGGEDIDKDDIFCGVGPPLSPGKESEWAPTAVVRTPSNVYNSINKTAHQYRDPRVFSVRSADADALEIVKGGAIVLSLAKEDGNWWVRAPRRERAESFTASGFVNQVLGWRIAKFHDDHPGPEGNYGLDPPAIEVVASGGGKAERLRIGKEHADGRLARRADAKFVWGLKPEDVAGLDRNPDEFLDRRLFRAYADEVTEVRLGRPGGEIVLAKDAASRTFRLRQPREIDANADRASDLLAEIEKLEIATWEPPLAPGESRPATGPSVDEGLRRYGLDAAGSWIQLASKGKPSKILFGNRDGEFVFVRREGSDNVGRLKAADLDRVLAREALHFVTKEIVQFSEFDLVAIEIEAVAPAESQPASVPATQPSGGMKKARWVRTEAGKWERTGGAPAEAEGAFTGALDSLVHLKGDEARSWSAEGFPFDRPLATIRYWKGAPSSRPAEGAPPSAEVKIAERDGTVAVGPSGVVHAIAADFVAKVRGLP